MTDTNQLAYFIVDLAIKLAKFHGKNQVPAYYLDEAASLMQHVVQGIEAAQKTAEG